MSGSIDIDEVLDRARRERERLRPFVPFFVWSAMTDYVVVPLHVRASWPCLNDVPVSA